MISIHLDGRDLECGCEAAMKFRLTYEDVLYSSKPGETDKRVAHKHDIRRKIHVQLKEYWRTNRFLNSCKLDSAAHGLLPGGTKTPWAQHPNERRPLADILGDVYGHHGFRFVPLIWKDADLACSLRILCLRRDTSDALLPARDIDNRIKTLIDALALPPHTKPPIDKNGDPMVPGTGEDPFFVLLDDDRQITHLEVETDTALAPDPANADNEAFVRLVITVEVRTVQTTMFNLGYA